MSYEQYKYYEIHIKFLDSKEYFEYLLKRITWQVFFNCSTTFTCGLKKTKVKPEEKVFIFETTSKRTYARDILTKFQVLFKGIQKIKSFNKEPKIELFAPENCFYEDTFFPTDTFIIDLKRNKFRGDAAVFTYVAVLLQYFVDNFDKFMVIDILDTKFKHNKLFKNILGYMSSTVSLPNDAYKESTRLKQIIFSLLGCNSYKYRGIGLSIDSDYIELDFSKEHILDVIQI